MKTWILLAALLAGVTVAVPGADGTPAAASPAPAAAQAPVRFQTFDLFLDSGTEALAAYQVEITAGPGVKLVGIEGGASPVFRDPPHFDPKALQQDRAILGAFSLAPATSLPRGRTRVATVHVQVTQAGPPQWVVRSRTAAGPDGRKITVTATLEPRETHEPRQR